MTHWSDINPATAVLIALSLFIVGALGLFTYWRFRRARKVVLVACAAGFLANPITEAVLLMPLSESMTEEILGRAKREGIVGRPASEARRVLGEPDEEQIRPPGRIEAPDGGILRRFDPYTVWWYRPVKLCPFCGAVRVTITASGIVSGITVP